MNTKIIFKENGKVIEKFENVSSFASWFNKLDETYFIEVKKDDSVKKALKTLINDIREIPDGDLDRYLIIDEIKKIIKEIKLIYLFIFFYF